jgi:hypothetical protein
MRRENIVVGSDYAYSTGGSRQGPFTRVTVIDPRVESWKRSRTGVKKKFIGPRVRLASGAEFAVLSRELVAPWDQHESRMKDAAAERERAAEVRARTRELLGVVERKIVDRLQRQGWMVAEFRDMGSGDRLLPKFHVDPVSGEVRGLPVQVLWGMADLLREPRG